MIFYFQYNKTKITTNIAIQQKVSMALAGQTRGAIGLSLNFLFLFCSGKKERNIQYHQSIHVNKSGLKI